MKARFMGFLSSYGKKLCSQIDILGDTQNDKKKEYFFIFKRNNEERIVE